MHLPGNRKRQALAGVAIGVRLKEHLSLRAQRSNLLMIAAGFLTPYLLLLLLFTPPVYSTQVDYDDLPKEDAIVFTNGNGARELAVFSDPYCGPCRRLERNLTQLNDVTIYLYLFPLRQFGERRVKAVNIWCAPDPAKAWRDWMFNKKSPNLVFCANPVDDLVELGHEIGVRGTPTLIHPNGQKTSGVMPVRVLDKWLGPVEKEEGEESEEIDR